MPSVGLAIRKYQTQVGASEANVAHFPVERGAGDSDGGFAHVTVAAGCDGL